MKTGFRVLLASVLLGSALCVAVLLATAILAAPTPAMADAVDHFSNYAPGLSAPANDIWLITPHDTNELDYVTRGIYVTTAGNLNVVMVGGAAAVEFYASAGWHPLRVKQVKVASSDAATGLVGAR